MCATKTTNSRGFRRIEPKISDHFKVLFRNMENELLNILEDDIVIPGLVVTVAPGTYTEQYCREQGIPYEYAK